MDDDSILGKQRSLEDLGVYECKEFVGYSGGKVCQVGRNVALESGETLGL